MLLLIHSSGTLGSLAMVEDQCCDNHVILKRTGENIRYCKVMDIVSIAQQVSIKESVLHKVC